MTDVAKKIVTMMSEQGVAGLPRNYELFYEAVTGANQDLTKEVARLSGKTSQEDLDKLGRRYLAHHHGHGVFEEAQTRMATQIKDVLALLREEQTSLLQYGKVLGDSTVKMGSRGGSDNALLAQIVNLLSEATSSTLDHGKKVVVSMNEKSTEIKKINGELERYKKLANTDPLTRLANRRAFDSHIAEVHGDKKAAMYSSLIFADIDHFKRINDSFGHIVGDKILSYVAGILSKTCGDDAFVARIGGEEFAIAHSDTTEKMASKVAEEVRAAVEDKKFINNKSGVDYGPVTLSLGVCMGSEADDATDLFRKTDQALYASKNSGRNRVTRFSEIPPGNGKAFKDWLLYRRQ
ncbi:GGDEF domain-containing protein [Hoeflea sp.]|uniref:GGDEF domain-containing protein n=1 Tax=Hoeflea sp. TaxID=1940281 RepID=UPI003B020515